MTNGFVAVHRSIQKLPIWQKPPYYFKIYMYLYLNAAFVDSEVTKRGEAVTDIDELVALCTSGRGGSQTGPSMRDIKTALKYICSEDSQLHVRCISNVNGKLRFFFERYDGLTNSKQSEMQVRTPSGVSQTVPTILYNKNDNNNKYNRVESRAKALSKPTKFNNFDSRTRDYEEIKRKAREQLKQRAEALRKEERGA